MAMSQINIEDEQAARTWLRDAENLNQRTERALADVAQHLKDLSSGAEGDLIQTVVDLSDRVVTATTDVMKGMGELLSVVNDVLANFGQVMEAVVTGAQGVISKLFG